MQHCSVAAMKAQSQHKMCQVGDSRGCCHVGVIKTLPQLRQQLGCSALPALADGRQRLGRRRTDAALLCRPPPLQPPLHRRCAAADHALPGCDPQGLWRR